MAPFAATLVLIVAICAGAVHYAGVRAVHRQQARDLDRLVALVRRQALSTGELTPEVGARLGELAGILDTRITLVAGDGAVLFDTHADAGTMANHNRRPEIQGARRAGMDSSVRRSGTLDEQSVYVAELLDPAKPDGMVLRLSYPRPAWVVDDAPIGLIVGGAIVAAMVAMGWFALLLHRRWIGPAIDMAGSAERIAGGEWALRLAPAGADEMRLFADKVNAVADHAQRRLDELNDRRAELETMVDTLPDPILLIDAEGRVALINAPAAAMLSAPREKALGRNAVSVITDKSILQLWTDAQRPADAIGDGAPKYPRVQRDIRLHRAGGWFTYQAAGIRTAAGGVLLALRDVSALADAMRMKTDFVANASHELRTPIAAIKIAFETLRDVLDEDPEQTDRCVNIIDGHMRRLEEMLADLLDLSRVESPEITPQIAAVDPTDLFATARSTLGPLARERGLSLSFVDERPEPGETIRTDARLVNLVLKNLVENAIKFTPAGGTITVRLSAADDAPGAWSLGVADSGAGIAPEHLERVFERFYQVDPVRGGGAGRGTGLGLAIVKHAVAALGGTVSIQSRIGQGTTVRCVIGP